MLALPVSIRAPQSATRIESAGTDLILLKWVLKDSNLQTAGDEPVALPIKLNTFKIRQDFLKQA